MKEYILSIVIAAIICAISGVLLPENTAVGRISKLLCGILLVVTIVSPLLNVSFQKVSDYISDFTASADIWVEEGNETARTQIDAIIKEKTEAYILDKANQMGLQIAVEVSLDENNHSIPSSVTVSGSISPYTKEVLSDYIATTLDIAKEKQIWISHG